LVKKKNLSGYFDQIKKPKSLNEITYRQLKTAIIEGKLAPGELYTELGLAKSLGISRTPVREALLRLATENFIIFHPRRGMSINLFTPEEVENLYELRQALEETAFSKIAGNLTPEQIQEVKNIIREQENSEKSFSKHDRKFHLFLIEAHGNRFVTQTYNNLLDYITILIRKTLMQKGRAKEAIREHREILESLIRGDARRTQEAVTRHLQNSKMSALERIARIKNELLSAGE